MPINTFRSRFEHFSYDIISKSTHKLVLVATNNVQKLALDLKVKAHSNLVLISEQPPIPTDQIKEQSKINRLVAALSQSLIIYNSQTEHEIEGLISNFLQLNKKVFCYLNLSENDQNQHWIKQGATLITTITNTF